MKITNGAAGISGCLSFFLDDYVYRLSINNHLNQTTHSVAQVAPLMQVLQDEGALRDPWGSSDEI